MNIFRLGLTTLIVGASLSFALTRGMAAEPAIAQNWASQFAAIRDLQITVHDVIVSGDKLVAKVTYTGR
jgi:predicted ester cyclase